jgi:hypothetical protein
MVDARIGKEKRRIVRSGLTTLAGAAYCGWRRRKQPAQA